ncbi:MAG: tetratricopeptide repeat protein [Phycisphaerales bacterium]|nr:tetratricopeptide repeat protein [Phycisphaerales bacterium]
MDNWLDAEQLADQAMDLLDRGRWAQAEAQLRRALAVDPQQREWRFNLGVVLEAQGQDAKAAEAFDQAVDPAADDTDALLCAAAAWARVQHWSNAADRLRQTLERDASIEAAHARLIEVLRLQGEHEDAETAFYMAEHALDGPSADCLCEIGESLATREQWRRAAWCLRQATRLDATMGHARRRLADVLAKMGQVQRAVEVYESELRTDPDQIDLLVGYAGLLEQLGRLEDAAMRLQHALDLDPTSIEANHRLGVLALRMRCPDRAAVAFQLVRRLDRTHPTVQRDLAHALLCAGQRGDASRMLTTIVQHEREAAEDGHSASIPDQLALIDLLSATGLHADAAERVEAVLAGGLTPDVHHWRQFARVRFLSGDLDGGRAASRRVLRHEPTCVASIGNLARAALLQGSLDEAAGWIRKGRSLDRGDARLRSLRTQLWVARLRAMLVR